TLRRPPQSSPYTMLHSRRRIVLLMLEPRASRRVRVSRRRPSPPTADSRRAHRYAPRRGWGWSRSNTSRWGALARGKPRAPRAELPRRRRANISANGQRSGLSLGLLAERKPHTQCDEHDAKDSVKLDAEMTQRPECRREARREPCDCEIPQGAAGVENKSEN